MTSKDVFPVSQAQTLCYYYVPGAFDIVLGCPGVSIVAFVSPLIKIKYRIVIEIRYNSVISLLYK